MTRIAWALPLLFAACGADDNQLGDGEYTQHCHLTTTMTVENSDPVSRWIATGWGVEAFEEVEETSVTWRATHWHGEAVDLRIEQGVFPPQQLYLPHGEGDGGRWVEAEGTCSRTLVPSGEFGDLPRYTCSLTATFDGADRPVTIDVGELEVCAVE
ncbi:hypothetical protein [Vulgatibacter sp.]|uniref:hypothetical protein n=1 Tax=Vulgatibacter sp. TaxID=1971226 RepID=UPI0035690EC4